MIRSIRKLFFGKRIELSILMSLIFIVLVGVPLYGILYGTERRAYLKLEEKLKKDYSYRRKFAANLVSQELTILETVSKRIRYDGKFVEHLASKNIDQLSAELEEFLSETDESIIDFAMLRLEKMKDPLVVSSSIFDVNSIVQKIDRPDLRFKKGLHVGSVDSSKGVVVYAHLTYPIVVPESGQVIGDLTVGIILNSNMGLFESLSETGDLEELRLYYQKELIFELSHNPSVPSVAFKEKEDIRLEEEYIYVPIDLKFKGDETVVLAMVYSSNEFRELREGFDNQKLIFVLVVLILGLVFFSIQTFMIVWPLKKLVQFARGSGDGKNSSWVIYEFQHLADEIGRSFLELENLNARLEKTVQRRTMQLNEKSELLETQVNELKFLQAKTIAQERLTALGLMLTGVAHEVKNPLNIIKNAGHLLVTNMKEVSDSKSDQVKLNKYLEREGTVFKLIDLIARQSDRVVKMIDSMQGQSGYLSNDLVKVPLKKLIQENISFALQSQSIEFTGLLTIEQEFADLSEVAVYDQELGQVLVNVLRNALYALEQKLSSEMVNYRPILKVQLNCDNKNFIIRVYDNGGGIPVNKIEKIFDPFVTYKVAGQGAGLGLSVAKDIVLKHHGFIEVESEHGSFTEFTIVIPLHLEKSQYTRLG